MEKFYTWIVRHRRLVIFVYLLAAGICACLQNLVSVNYDMNDYLPPDTASTKSLEVMEEEFEGGIPNVRVMIRDVSVPEALEYKEKLREMDGVTEVAWLNDVIDVTIPQEMFNPISYSKENDPVKAATLIGFFFWRFSTNYRSQR